jgi:hypothetical protein
MTEGIRNRGIVALIGVLAVTAVPGGCGFNDTLTTRGFISSGDQVCVTTFVRAGRFVTTHPEISGSEFLTHIGNAFGQAAPGFRRLPVRSEDEAMRDHVASSYASFARRLRTAARAPTTASQAAQAGHVFSAISVLAREMRNYGFQACGALPAAARQ